jgi:hypothetical protein
VEGDILLGQADLLVRQVAHWTPARWKGRGEAVYALVQRLADAAAAAEGQPSRVVPRLADTVLPDQVRVIVADLVAASPAVEVAAALAADIRSVRLAF